MRYKYKYKCYLQMYSGTDVGDRRVGPPEVRGWLTAEGKIDPRPPQMGFFNSVGVLREVLDLVELPDDLLQLTTSITPVTDSDLYQKERA